MWDAIEDVGADEIQIAKGRGHVTEEAVRQGRTRAIGRLGKGHADHFACVGRDLAEELAPTVKARQAHREAIKLYRFLAKRAACDLRDTVAKARIKTRKRLKQLTVPPKMHSTHPHRVQLV